jgi:TetR/AcrR family transcriptional regulator, regulator of autoinduction and epiphytic fitness
LSRPTEQVPAGKADGRVLRSTRTRAAIIDAHFALMLEGDLQPTAAKVAERAGVSLRTLWAHFQNLEAMFAAAGQKALQVQYAGFRPIPADQPLADRIEQFCKQRAQMLESIAGASRAAQLRIEYSPQLRQNRARHTARLREELAELFAPELAAAGDAAPDLLTTMVVATTWPTWMGMRDDLALPFDRATVLLRRTVASLLHEAAPGLR